VPKITITPDKNKILEIFSEKVMIQEPMRSYSAFFDGLDLYSFNSLLYPVDIAVINKYNKFSNRDINDFYEYYQSFGFAPKKIIEFKTTKTRMLFEKYVRKSLASKKIRKLIVSSQGSYVQNFILKVSKINKNIREELGLGKFEAAAIDTEYDSSGKIISGFVNNDIWLREVLTDLGLDRINLDYIILDNFKNQKEDIKKLLLKRGSVVVKTIGFAAGIGIKKAKTIDEILHFVIEMKKKYGKALRFIITEDISSIIIEERSFQIFINHNSKINFLAVSKNLVRNNSNFGNVINTSPEDELNNIEFDDFIQVESLAKYIARIGYVGYISFDMAFTTEGYKIFEINGRMGGCSPLIGVLPAMKEKIGSEISLVINTVQLNQKKNNFDFWLVLLRLGKIALSEKNKRGVIVTNPAVLPQKVTLIAVSESEDESLELINKSRKLLI